MIYVSLHHLLTPAALVLIGGYGVAYARSAYATP